MLKNSVAIYSSFKVTWILSNICQIYSDYLLKKVWLIAEICALNGLLCNYIEIDVSKKVRGRQYY